MALKANTEEKFPAEEQKYWVCPKCGAENDAGAGLALKHEIQCSACKARYYLHSGGVVNPEAMRILD